MMVICHDCYASSWPDYSVDNDLWLELGPTKNAGGLLCLNCLAARFQAKYLGDGPNYPLVIYVGGAALKEK